MVDTQNLKYTLRTRLKMSSQIFPEFDHIIVRYSKSRQFRLKYHQRYLIIQKMFLNFGNDVIL